MICWPWRKKIPKKSLEYKSPMNALWQFRNSLAGKLSETNARSYKKKYYGVRLVNLACALKSGSYFG